MPTRPAHAAVYLRISRDLTGEGLAVERHRAECERIVAERGWTVREVYTDNSISASDRRRVRPAYDRLIADARAGRFQHVVCYDLDRLTRQPRQLEDWIDLAEDHHVTPVTANGEADLATDGGRLYARVKSLVRPGGDREEGCPSARRCTPAIGARTPAARPSALGPRLTAHGSRANWLTG